MSTPETKIFLVQEVVREQDVINHILSSIVKAQECVLILCNLYEIDVSAYVDLAGFIDWHTLTSDIEWHERVSITVDCSILDGDTDIVFEWSPMRLPENYVAP